MKEIENDKNKWKHMPCSWIDGLEELIFFKCLYYPELTMQTQHTQFQCNPYQNTKSIFHRTRTDNPKICMDSQSSLVKEEQSLEVSIIIPGSKLYHSFIVIKTVWH